MGDIVVSRSHGDIYPAKIVAFAPKKVKMKLISRGGYHIATDEFYNFPTQIAKIDQNNALLWLMKKDG